jgi:hypothetical protein
MTPARFLNKSAPTSNSDTRTAASQWPWLLLSLLCLGGVLMLPSGVASALNGLPWMKPGEALIVCAALPLLLLLDRTWLRFRPAVFFIAVLLCLKLVLALYAPQAGWCLRIHSGPESARNGIAERTWEGIWRSGCSAILAKPYVDARDFPAEWLNRLDKKERRETTPHVFVAGYAVVPRGWGLAVAAGGMRGGLLRAHDESGRLLEVPLVKEPSQANSLNPAELPSGLLSVSGRLAYGPLGGSNWALIPLLVGPKGQVVPASGRGVLWRDRAGADLNPDWLKRLAFMAKAVVWGLGLWLLGWLFSALIRLSQKRVLNSSVLWAMLAGFLIWWLLPRVGHDPLFVPHGAAFAALGVLTVLGFRKNAVQPASQGLAALLVIGPLLLIHFGSQWAAEAGRFSLYTVGDDWLTYQRHAYDIVLGQDYLMAKRQPILYEQPLYRYVVAFLHVFFGQSAMAQNLLDVWSAIGATGLCAVLTHRLGGKAAWGFLAAWLYVNYELGDRFLLHIGLGLQEHTAMLFMLLAAWGALRARENIAWMWLAGAMAALGFWLRMDHLGVLAGLGLLVIAESCGGFLAAWGGLIKKAWAARKCLCIYWGLLVAAVFLIILRNWLVGGEWVLLHPANKAFLHHALRDNFLSLLYVLDGSAKGSLISARVLWPGTLVGLAALLIRVGPLSGYPLALGLSLAGLLAPYLYVQPSAYFPRWSVHLLPLACVSLALFGGAITLASPFHGGLLKSKTNRKTAR